MNPPAEKEKLTVADGNVSSTLSNTQSDNSLEALFDDSANDLSMETAERGETRPIWPRKVHKMKKAVWYA